MLHADGYIRGFQITDLQWVTGCICGRHMSLPVVRSRFPFYVEEHGVSLQISFGIL